MVSRTTRRGALRPAPRSNSLSRDGASPPQFIDALRSPEVILPEFHFRYVPVRHPNSPLAAKPERLAVQPLGSEVPAGSDARRARPRDPPPAAMRKDFSLESARPSRSVRSTGTKPVTVRGQQTRALLVAARNPRSRRLQMRRATVLLSLLAVLALDLGGGARGQASSDPPCEVVGCPLRPQRRSRQGSARTIPASLAAGAANRRRSRLPRHRNRHRQPPKRRYLPRRLQQSPRPPQRRRRPHRRRHQHQSVTPRRPLGPASRRPLRLPRP